MSDLNPNATARKVFRVDQELFNKLEDFKDQVLLAKANQSEWLETSEEVINYFNPRGLGNCPLRKKPNEHFTYEGVKVCKVGQSERIEEELNEDLDHRNLGTKRITVDGR